MRNAVAFFVKHMVLVRLAMLLIILFGVWGFRNLTYSLFPEIDPFIILVEATWLGASPEEMEEGVVVKIEDNLRGLTGIERVTSVSSENLGLITIELRSGEDINVMLQEVNNEIDRIATFPPGLERLVVYKEEALSFTARIAITGAASLRTLKQTAQIIEDDLLAFPHISQVELRGFPEEEIEISVREEVLQAYGLTFDEVATAVSTSNIELSGGTIKTAGREIRIRADELGYFAADLENIPVRAGPAGIVRLKDVANIRDTWADDPRTAFLNGKRSVIVEVETTPEENLLEAAEFIRNYITDFNERNEAIQATLVDDGSTSLQNRLDMLVQDGIIGAVLVLVFLGFFLELRVAFWVAVSIPISFLGMFALGNLYGLTINLLSLFGMIMVVGILVDDGVVVGENIYQQYEDGKKRLDAALDGAMEVLPAIAAGLSTTAIAFGFFFFVEGITGDYFQDLSFVVIASLLMSFIEVFFLLPARLAHSKALKGDSRQKSGFLHYTSKLMVRFRDRFYAPLLLFSMKNKLFLVLIVTTALVLSFGAMAGGVIRFAFFPDVELDRIFINLEMPPGTRETVTDSVLAHIERAAWEADEDFSQRNGGETIIRSVEREVGPSPSEGLLTVTLTDPEDRVTSITAVANAIRERAGTIRNAEQLSFDTGIPFGKPVAFSLSSRDIDALRRAKDDLRAALQELPQLTDVVDNELRGQPELHISLTDRAKMLGLTLQEVVGQVRSGFFGQEIQRLQRGQDEVIVWVRYEETTRTSIAELERMRIRTADGGEFPLREIAVLREQDGVTAINRRDGRRAITVEADVVDRSVSVPDVNEQIQTRILPEIVARYPGVDYMLEGQSREFGRTLDSIIAALPTALLLIAAILIATFRSFGQALALILITPLSFIGAVWGHWLHGLPFSLFSGLGIIALIGIMVNDGLVLVNTYNANLLKMNNIFDAMIRTGKDRFRPIVLTTITTVAGLAPLLLNPSIQAQFLQPMAVSVAYGLIVGSFLTLTMLPVLLLILNRGRRWFTWLFTGKRKSAEELEPAIKETKNTFEDED